jgi:tyrosine-protein phosphatase SIW14
MFANLWRHMAIPNFIRINDWLYRGGQPDMSGFEQLQEMGVKTIISLRWSSEILAKERVLAGEMGFNYFAIPLSYTIYPNRAQIQKFFAILDNPELHPIFLHCKYGSDRTGMMVAFYRMAREGWDAKRAYEEMRSSGFHVWLVHHYKWAVFHFERRLERMRRAQMFLEQQNPPTII